MKVEILPKVANWVRGKGQYDKLVQIGKEITSSGTADDVAGLRHIVKKVYDVKVPGAGDYRIVGQVEGNTFRFRSVYSHGKKGKVLEEGDRIDDYAKTQK